VRSDTLSWIADFLSGRFQEVILEGKHSAQCKVTSGVPQGTVLGPLLFFAYINDMPPCVSSSARLFADYCLLYRPITTEIDATKLQEDIDALQNWEITWQMSFNPDKCEVLRITDKRNKIMANYYIHGQQLQIVDNAKYLGLTISKNLSWNNRVNNITKKAHFSPSPSFDATSETAHRELRHRPTTHSYDHHLNMPLLCGIHIRKPTSIK
jgi:hypothetical protein